MKRLKKLLFWGLALAVILVIISAVALALFFPKEEVKKLALVKLSAALNRPIKVDAVSITFWGGIGLNLENIRVANAENFEEEYFLTASGLDVKVQFWPLLKREVHIDRVILNKPLINARKLADGRVNYDFSASDTPVPPEVREALPEDSRLASMAALSLDNMTVKNGYLNYTDDSSGIAFTAEGLEINSSIKTVSSMVFSPQGSLVAHKVNIRYEDMKLPQLTAELKFTGRIDLNKSNAVFSLSEMEVNRLPLNTKIGIPNLKTFDYVNIELESGRLDIADIMTIIPNDYLQQMQGYRISGYSKAKIDIKYNTLLEDGLRYSGNATLENVSIAGDSLPLAVNITKGSLLFDDHKIDLNIEKGDLLDNPFTGSASIFIDENPIANLKINGGADLSKLIKLLPEQGKVQLSGTISYDLEITNLTSRLSQMNLGGKLSIANGKYISEDLPEPVNSFGLDLSFLRDRIKVSKLAVALESSDFSYTGEVFDLIPFLLADSTETPPPPRMTFTLTSTMLNIDSLMPEAVPGVMADSIEISAENIPPVFVPLIDGTGSCRLDTLKYSGVEFTNLTADINIKNKSINISDIKGNAYSGKILGNSIIDFSNPDIPVYSGDIVAENVEANDFMSSFTSLGSHLFGKVNMSGNFKTSGWDAEPIINSLSLDGNADFKEARLVNFELVQKLATALKIDTIDEEKLRDLTTAFHVKDGRVAFDKMQFLSKLGDWALDGSVGFDGSLDYQGTVLLSEQVTANLLSQKGLLGNMSGLFKQKSTGRVKIPFTLSGTYSNPEFGLNLSSSEDLQDNLKDNLGDALKDLFKKK